MAIPERILHQWREFAKRTNDLEPEDRIKLMLTWMGEERIAEFNAWVDRLTGPVSQSDMKPETLSEAAALGKLSNLFTAKHAETLAKVPSISAALGDWTGDNMSDAYELGRQVGYAECAKEVHDALATLPKADPLVSPEDPPARPGQLSGYGVVPLVKAMTPKRRNRRQARKSARRAI